MANWGRSGDPQNAATLATVPGKLGKRSLILAIVAFALASGSFAMFGSLPKDASEMVSNLAIGAFLVIVLLAAPAMHITGIVFGLMAISRSNDSRVLGLIGFLLNAALLAIGALLLWAATSTIGAFT